MTTRRKVTIEDVAEACAVSRQTVSRVINHSPNVKPAVRQRIEEAIERLGYSPNLAARRMGGNRSYLIVAVNDRARTLENWQAGRGNDWVDQMLFGGVTVCEREGYRMVFELIDTEPTAARRALAGVIGALRPDGVILTPPHCDNADLVALLDDQGIPCARVGHSEDGRHVDVSMDEAGAAHEATRHLIALGHRRIGFLAGSPSYGVSKLRIDGYRRALADAGLADEGLAGGADLVRKGDFHFATAAAMVEDLLAGAAPPTAILADNDEMAFATLHVASRHGLEVPSGISVISFEDTPGVRFSVPPLTAIRQPTAALIGTACAKLIAITRGEPAQGRYVLPYELVLRETTGRPAA